MWCKWCERQDNGSVFLDVRAGHAGRKDDDNGCDVRVTLSKLFHQRARRPLTLGSERRDLSWTVVHSDIRSYYEWCQTTFSFLARVSRRAASSRPLVCVRLGSRPKANIWPASSPHIVLSLSITQIVLSVNIYAAEATHFTGKNNISHQPLCFGLLAWTILLPLSHVGMIVFTRWACIRHQNVIIRGESLIIMSLVCIHLEVLLVFVAQVLKGDPFHKM